MNQEQLKSVSGTVSHDYAVRVRTGKVAGWAFWFLLTIAFILRSWLALKGHPIIRQDEIFQTIEQSHRLVFGSGIVPWEYEEGIRWMGTPLVLSIPMLVAKALGLGAGLYIPLIRLLLVTLALAPIPLFYRLVASRSSPWVAFFACVLPLFWPEILAFSGSTLSDAISAPVLLAAVLLVFDLDRSSSRQKIVAFGALVALAFCLRFHFAPALAVAVVTAWLRVGVQQRRALLWTAAVAVLLLSALDIAVGQRPFQHVYLNIYENLVKGVAAHYGTLPLVGVLCLDSEALEPRHYTGYSRRNSSLETSMAAMCVVSNHCSHVQSDWA